MNYLVLSREEFVAVFKEELVGGPEAGLDAVFDNGGGTRRTCKFLHLHPEEGDARQQIHSGLEVHQLLLGRRREIVSVR